MSRVLLRTNGLFLLYNIIAMSCSRIFPLWETNLEISFRHWNLKYLFHVAFSTSILMDSSNSAAFKN